MNRYEALLRVKVFHLRETAADRVIEAGQWVFRQIVDVALRVRELPPHQSPRFRWAFLWTGFEDIAGHPLTFAEVERLWGIMGEEEEGHP